MRAQHNQTFPSFTKQMTIELAKNVVIFLNNFPPKSGLSKIYSPHKIMTGKAVDWKKIYKFNFVAYVKVHEDRNVTIT